MIYKDLIIEFEKGWILVKFRLDRNVRLHTLVLMHQNMTKSLVISVYSIIALRPQKFHQL